MASDPKYGIEPPKKDDGSYKSVLGQLGFLYLKPDGHTLVNVNDGTEYDLANIGSGGSSSYGDEDAQDAVGLNLDSTLTYSDSTPSFGIASGGVGTTELAADAVTAAKIAASAVGSTQLDNEAVQDIAGGMAGNGLAYDDANNTVSQNVAASGQVTLSSGTAVVDTAISATDATFQLALGIDDPAADCKVTGRLFWDDSAGTYKVEIVEDGTNVGNPTINYDIIRVR